MGGEEIMEDLFTWGNFFLGVSALLLLWLICWVLENTIEFLVILFAIALIVTGIVAAGKFADKMIKHEKVQEVLYGDYE